MCNNRKSAASTLSNNQLQVLITGRFGDGCLYCGKSCNNFMYIASCKEKELIELKKSLLGDLCKADIEKVLNKGYKLDYIYKLRTKHSELITSIAIKDPLELLEYLDELGLALWMYDEGSLHKKCKFYNINTQAYSEYDNIRIAEVLKRRFNVIAKPTIERKKDGRVFWYLRVCKLDGAFFLSEIMRKHLPPSLHRKCISSETIQRWSKLQEELKSRGIDKELRDLKISNMTHGWIEKGTKSIQDIVRSYIKV